MKTALLGFNNDSLPKGRFLSNERKPDRQKPFYIERTGQRKHFIDKFDETLNGKAVVLHESRNIRNEHGSILESSNIYTFQKFNNDSNKIDDHDDEARKTNKDNAKTANKVPKLFDPVRT